MSEAALPRLATVTFQTGPMAGQTFQLTQPSVTIGRDSTNDVVVKGDLRVSRHHARLVWAGGVWIIEKLAERNWITVNQQRVQQARLQDQAVVQLGGETSFVFTLQPAGQEMDYETMPQVPKQAPSALEVSPARPISTPAVSAAPAGGPVSEPPQPSPGEGMPSPGLTAPPVTPAALDEHARSFEESAGRRGTAMIPRRSQTLVAAAWMMGIPTLEVRSTTTDARKRYPLAQKTLSIGRDATNDIVIDEPCVSGQHLQLVCEGQQWVLVHPHPTRTSTANGLLYQGRKIRGDESYRKVLEPGDVFRIGDEDGTLVTLTYADGSGMVHEAVPEVKPIRLEAAEITIGRKSDNIVVLPHPLVSAHHAKLVREGGTYRILDLHSTNHVYVNAELVTSHLLKLGDEIRIGPYRLVYEGTELVQHDESRSIRIDALNLRKVGARGATLLNNISLSIPPRAFVALVGGSGAGKSTLLDALSGLRPAEAGQVLYNGQDYYRNQAAFSAQIGYVPQDDIVHRELTVERALYYAAKIRLPGDFTEEQIWRRIDEVLEDVELLGRRQQLIRKLSGGQRKRVSIALELLANPSLFFLDEPTSGLDPGLDRKMMVLVRKLADKGHTIVLVTHATNNINVCDYVCFLAPGGRLAYFGPPDGAKAFFNKGDFAEIYSVLEPTDERPNAPEEAEARFKLSEEYQQYIAGPLKGASKIPAGQARPKEVRTAKQGSAWRQFWLLSLRRLELLRNDLPTLLVLLLQAPLVAILLMVLIRFGLGADILAGDNIVQCQPQIRLSAQLAQQLGEPAGVLVVPGAARTGETVSCQQVQAFLVNDARGQQYAAARGGVDQALQDFEVAGHNGDAQRIVFMLALIPVLFGIIGGSLEVVKEAAIYRRERAVNLRILPYLGSKILVFGVLALVQMASVVVIVEIFEPLHQGVFLPVLLEAYITLALAGVAGLLLGFVISAWSPHADTANSLLAGVIVPQVIFSGVIVPLKDPVTQSIAMLFPLRWAMAALGSSLGLHSELVGGDRLFGDGDNYLYHSTLFSTYSQSEAAQRIVLCWVAMGVILLVSLGLVGLAMRRKDVQR